MQNTHQPLIAVKHPQGSTKNTPHISEILQTTRQVLQMRPPWLLRFLQRMTDLIAADSNADVR